MRGVSLLLLALGLGACGDDDQEPRSKLLEYRIIGIRADPPAVGLAGQVRLNVVDFSPAQLEGEVERSYEWTVCLSAGPFDAYNCIEGLPTLERATPEPVLDVNLFELLAETAEALGLDPMDSEEYEAGQEEELPLYVRVRATEGEAEQVAAKRIFLKFGSDNACSDAGEASCDASEGEEACDCGPNRNPAVLGIAFPGHSGVVTGAPPGTVIALEVKLAEDAAEAVINDEGEPDREFLLYTWFSSDGEFDRSVTAEEDTEVNLQLPDEPGPLRLFVAVRDDRGGLSVVQHDLEVAEAE